MIKVYLKHGRAILNEITGEEIEKSLLLFMFLANVFYSIYNVKKINKM